MNYSSITQLALLIIAVAIVLTYIKPTMVEIKTLQDELFQYADTKDKASEFNQQLATLVAEEQSFRKSDIEALETYLPTSVDILSIMSDIEVIARNNNLALTSLSSAEVAEARGEIVFEEGVLAPSPTASQDIDVVVSGEYEDFKNMLLDFERNKYVLEVVKLEIGSPTSERDAAAGEVPLGSYNLVLRSYAFEYSRLPTVAEDGQIQPEVIE